MRYFDVHVSLLRDKLHGTLNLWVGALAAVAYIRSISQSFKLQEKKYTHVRDHLEYMGWHKRCVEMGVCRDAKG